MRDGNCVAVGWDKVGDLTWLDATKDSRTRLQQLLSESHPNVSSVTGRSTSQLMQFVNSIELGDFVLAADGATILGIARVTGEYAYDPSSAFPHGRSVEWLSLDEWKMPDPEGLRTTVREVKKAVNLLETERKVQTRTGDLPKPFQKQTRNAPGPTRESHQLPLRLAGIAGRIQSVLARKSQCILYGPPGTGKTHWALRAANDLAAYSAFGKAFDSLGASDRELVTGAGRGDGLVRLCCFHPAYGYEDFVEGYRPESVAGQIAFRLRDGLLKRMAKEAERLPERKFVLIIDEINRGDIPRIFGELLTILETDKRGQSVVLPVSGEPFRMPPNLLIIGTMNTADRSISLLDAALRRRFGFVELMPDGSLLRNYTVAGVPLGPWLEALNQRICEHVGRDARHLQIGHSYLLQGGSPIKDLSTFRLVLRDDILPLLEEYCYEDHSALQSILGNGLMDPESRRIRHSLLEEGQEDELVQALLEPCPEITTSPAAISAHGDSEEDLEEDVESEGGTDP